MKHLQTYEKYNDETKLLMDYLNYNLGHHHFQYEYENDKSSIGFYYDDEIIPWKIFVIFNIEKLKNFFNIELEESEIITNYYSEKDRNLIENILKLLNNEEEFENFIDSKKLGLI